jgi:hypothetical protein
MTKLSHSGKGKFEHCSEMFNLHYNLKIRPVGTTSALLFGSAIDAAAEDYLLNGDRQRSIDTFNDKWIEQEINGILTDLKSSSEVQFHDNDFDHELLTESDHESIIKDTVYSSSSDLVEAGENKERIVLAKWISLYRKGQLIIDAFMNWADNNIDEVLEAQCMIELEDGEGNEITGKADFVIKMKGYDIPLLVDLKTAARYYERDSVKKSEQLAIYYYFLRNTKYPEMKRAAFLVLQKQIKKNREKTCLKCDNVTHGMERKCAVETMGTGPTGRAKKIRCNGEFSVQIFPEVTVQFIHDEIPEHFIDETVERFGYVINQINDKKFEKNLNGCNSYYGRECPYKRYCQSGCMDGLIKKEDK